MPERVRSSEGLGVTLPDAHKLLQHFCEQLITVRKRSVPVGLRLGGEHPVARARNRRHLEPPICLQVRHGKWVRSAFPEADIAEAAVVTTDEGSSYDLVIAAAQRSMEAKVRFAASEPLPTTLHDYPADKTALWKSRSTDLHPIDFAERVPDRYISSNDGPISLPSAAADAGSEDCLPIAEVESSPRATPVLHLQDAVTSPDEVPSDAVAAAHSAAIALARSVVASSLVGMLSSPGVVDASALARRLGALLDDIIRASQPPANEPTVGAGAMKFGAAAALLFAAQMLLTSRRPRLGPCLTIAAASSTWRWVLGVPPSERRSSRHTLRGRR